MRSFKSTRPPVFNLNGSGWRVKERRKKRGRRKRRGRKDTGEEEMGLKTLQIVIRML